MGYKTNVNVNMSDVNGSFWRVTYMTPIIINFIMIINFNVFIQEDSIMYNLSENKDDNALKLIKKVYSSEEDS